MANEWIEISNIDETNLNAAFALLRGTLDGYEYLDIPILQRKMSPPDKIPPTNLFCLRVFSFGERANLGDPLASAFFFLRRNHQRGEKKPQAYCLTVGAKDQAKNGLNAADLKDALVRICIRMRPIATAGQASLEVMHRGNVPNFKVQNLIDVYTALTTAQQPPRLVQYRENIRIQEPWTRLEEESLKWLNIIEQ